MENLQKFDIFIIKTLPDGYFNKCKKSLIETSGGMIKSDQICMIIEKDSREKTLNTILEKRDIQRDLFIVADDIIFLNGWYESFVNNYIYGDIIGFSMIDAQTGLLQDFGYDFVSVNGDLSYRGLYKHKELKELNFPEFRKCDAVNGCAMYIKNNVIDDVKYFPLEGENRWGELLFSRLASKYGHETIVLNAHLRHYGISTKQNKDVKKSSMSWLIEKELWSKAVKKYLKDVEPKKEIKTAISDELVTLINQSKKCLIYGAGTVADVIITSLNEISKIYLCSGLKEEVGLQLRGIKIKSVNRLNLAEYDKIIISSIGYENQIIDSYFKKINVLTLSKESGIINIKNGS
jgi:hypothetical protein